MDKLTVQELKSQGAQLKVSVPNDSTKSLVIDVPYDKVFANHENLVFAALYSNENIPDKELKNHM